LDTAPLRGGSCPQCDKPRPARETGAPPRSSGCRAAAGPARRVERHRRGIVGRDKRMADKLHRQPRVGITRRLERKDRRQPVEVPRHLETPAGPRGPDLRADVIEQPRRSARLGGEPAIHQALTQCAGSGRRNRQSTPRAAGAGRSTPRCPRSASDSGRSWRRPRSPWPNPRSDPAAVGPRRRRGAGRRARRRAAGLAGQQLAQHARRMLVAGVLAGDDEQVNRAAAGGGKLRAAGADSSN
jgi:hypothetical protein